MGESTLAHHTMQLDLQKFVQSWRPFYASLQVEHMQFPLEGNQNLGMLVVNGFEYSKKQEYTGCRMVRHR